MAHLTIGFMVMARGWDDVCVCVCVCVYVCVGGCMRSQIGLDKGNNVLSVVMSILSHTETRAGVTRAPGV